MQLYIISYYTSSTHVLKRETERQKARAYRADGGNRFHAGSCWVFRVPFYAFCIACIFIISPLFSNTTPRHHNFNILKVYFPAIEHLPLIQLTVVCVLLFWAESAIFQLLMPKVNGKDLFFSWKLCFCDQYNEYTTWDLYLGAYLW